MGIVELLVGVIFTLALGSGIALTTSADSGGEFLWARICYGAAAAALAAGFICWARDDKVARKHKLVLGAFTVIFILAGTPAIFYWVSFKENKTLGKEQVQAQESVISNKNVVTGATLRQLFETDWPALPSYYMVSGLRGTDLPPGTTLDWRINGDFIARSKFLAIFIKSTVSSTDAALICEAVAAQYDFFIKDADGWVDIVGQPPGDSAPTHLRDMVFSGRIYVYYENIEFSIVQKATIEKFFSDRGLSVEFRDSAYVWAHHDEKRGLRPDQLHSNTVLLPSLHDIPAGLQIGVMKLR